MYPFEQLCFLNLCYFKLFLLLFFKLFFSGHIAWPEELVFFLKCAFSWQQYIVPPCPAAEQSKRWVDLKQFFIYCRTIKQVQHCAVNLLVCRKKSGIGKKAEQFDLLAVMQNNVISSLICFQHSPFDAMALITMLSYAEKKIIECEGKWKVSVLYKLSSLSVNVSFLMDNIF